MRAAYVVTHPIQYQIPWLRRLAATPGLSLTVLYAMIPDPRQQGVGFAVPFEWDIPLLDGYDYRRLENRARTPALDGFFGCNTPEVGRLLESFDAVIIHGWGVLSAQQALWGARRRRIPCILRGESSSLRPWPVLRRLAYSAFLSNYTAFLAIGRANRAFYRRHGVPADRIFDAPYCVDNDRFGAAAAELEPQRLSLRRSWGIADDATVILFCGKLIDKKRPLDLVNAIAVARDQNPRYHLLVAGEGPLRAACEDRARHTQVPATFLGFMNQAEITRAYVAADCLVLPSDYGETWGLVVNEAMACGRPAVVSDRVGCHLDLVRPGQTGDVFPFGSIQGLADAILGITTTADHLRTLGDQAREQVRQHYSMANLVEGTVQALRFATERIG